jgi:hydroxymethylglutaryl-CoA lyase
MQEKAGIALVEVGPRDGLQAERRVLPVIARAKLISLLDAAGLQRIEAGAFVSERLVPQMEGTARVLEMTRNTTRARLSVLTPNMQGFEKALAAGAREVAVLTAATEAFSRENLHCGVAESLDRAASIIDAARSRNVLVRGYISCVFGCPYEGAVPQRRPAEIARALHEMGCYEISLGDTIGVGAPLAVRRVVEFIAETTPMTVLAGHFHDTYGQALANIFACLEAGVTTFDCSVAGLGGCPFAPGAAGNVATEDVVYMLHGSGFHTGVSLDRLLEAGADVCKALGRTPQSRVARALAARPASHMPPSSGGRSVR